MANGSKPIRGINASMNLSAISLLIVLSGMFIIKYQVVKQEKTTLILRDQLLEERYAEMLKSRQMIHDMKNHLLVLRNMERANQWDKLHDYLEEISKDILDDSTKIWTGNNIVDLILNSKKKQADSEGIAFSIGSNMIGDVPFKDGETISLLGNLLDNAIEACERIKSTEKWVTIRINRRYCLLYIEIENSIEEHPKEKNHRLISCKSEKDIQFSGTFFCENELQKQKRIDEVIEQIKEKDNHADILGVTEGEELYKNALYTKIQWRIVRGMCALVAILFFMINETIVLMAKAKKERKIMGINLALGATERDIKYCLFFETLLVTLLAVFLVMITLRPLAKLASLEHIIILDSMVIVETVILAVWACEILTWIIVSRIKKENIADMVRTTRDI